MTANGVRVHRWRNEYIVAREHLAVDETRLALDAIARDLSGELAVGLAPWLGAGDDRVLLLNRLCFDCELDLSRERWSLARRWAYAFARALIRAADVECDGVLRFDSQAQFRAQFVSDLAAGHAWHLWYYETFAGLRYLPAAGAIRTLLLEDPALGRETLTALPPGGWTAVGTALTPIEASRILDGLSDAQAETDRATLAALLRAQVRYASAPDAWFVVALRLFLDVVRDGAAATPALAAFARVVAKAASLVARTDARAVARALAAGDVHALTVLDAAHDSAVWAPLAAYPAWRSLVADAIVDSAPGRADREHACSGEVFTAFGGFVMLFPEIDALLTAPLVDTLPRSGVENRRGLAAWIAMAHCAGSGGATAFVREAFWRDLFGVPPAITLDALRNWLEQSLAEPALAGIAALARQRGRGDELLTSFSVRGVRHRLVVDSASSLWIRFRGEPAVDGLQWRRRLRAARAARADWNYLAPSWNLPPDWDLFFAQVAQIALRRFAYRVPGFAGSSLRHVHANFLAARGRWDITTGIVHVSRSPLHTVLQLSGVGRGRIRWSGPPAVDLVLEFER